MKKYTFTQSTAIAFLVLLLIGGYLYLTKERAIAPTLTTQEPKILTYTNQKFGVAFDYPDTYTVTENNFDSTTGMGSGLNVTLLEKGTTIPAGGDGPTAITLSIHQSALVELANENALEYWIRNSQFSNFKTATVKDPVAMTVANEQAFTYSWDGLYPGRSVAVGKNGDVFMFSVTYNGETDTVKQEDFLTLLKTVKFSLPITTQINAPNTVMLRGIYECLPHKDTSGPQTEECIHGIKAEDGKHYAIDVSSVGIADSTVGTTIEVIGLLVPIEQISTNMWNKYDLTGIIKVSSFRKI